MLQLTIEELTKELSSLGFSMEYQAETGQIYTVLKIHGHDFPLFAKINEDGESLQLLIFMPVNYIEKSCADTARLLHLLNKEIDLPGFGMDESSQLIFFRTMLYSDEAKISKKLLEMTVRAIPKICESYTPIIAAVAQNNVAFADVIKEMKDKGN